MDAFSILRSSRLRLFRCRLLLPQRFLRYCHTLCLLFDRVPLRCCSSFAFGSISAPPFTAHLLLVAGYAAFVPAVSHGAFCLHALCVLVLLTGIVGCRACCVIAAGAVFVASFACSGVILPDALPCAFTLDRQRVGLRIAPQPTVVAVRFGSQRVHSFVYAVPLTLPRVTLYVWLFAFTLLVDFVFVLRCGCGLVCRWRSFFNVVPVAIASDAHARLVRGRPGRFSFGLRSLCLARFVAYAFAVLPLPRCRSPRCRAFSALRRCWLPVGAFTGHGTCCCVALI